MNTKNFIIGGLAGGIVNFLAGWLFYGVLFSSVMPADENMSMLFIFLGCLMFGVLLSYIYNQWANISTWMTGLTAGAVLGTITALWSNFFRFASETSVDWGLFALDAGISAAMGAITGAVIGFVLGKMKD